MGKNCRVLIVDDMDVSQLLLKNHLQRLGIKEIETACDGVSAVDLFCRAMDEGAPFNLVLLDIMMPNMCGQEALRLMREKEASCSADCSVIIMVTASDTTDNMMKALLDGDCTDYAVKPLSFEKLGKLLERYGFLNTPP